MRRIIQLLYLYKDQKLSPYAMHDLTEKMLQTYISQGITYLELSALYLKKAQEEQKEKS